MSVDLYDSHYGHLQAEAQRQVREETYGEDLGQASWITLDEYQTFLRWLDVGPKSRVLEVACGSGGISVRMARDTGAEVVGVDVNEHAIAAAMARAESLPSASVPKFRVADASQALPFPDESFDAIFCNDSINHLPDRERVLREWHRMLRPGGRLLYTDPIVVTGWLSNEEIAARASIGLFLFMPMGENERMLHDVGFELLRVDDVTENVAVTSGRWHAARQRRREVLVQFEGDAGFDGVQLFLEMVRRLATARRLSRLAFLGRKRV
jgi:ubiquinone/menaquinone biosynthesis C-methylase UbiE